MRLSRRALLASSVGAGVALPAAAGARWASGLEHRKPRPPAEPGEWRNWSGLQSARPAHIEVPPDEAALASQLAETRGPIRPVGSGHSFTPLVPTPGTLVDVSRLAGLRRANPDQRIAVLGAGTRLRAAATALAEAGLAFPNQPDIDVPTLAGCFATGSHGTGLELRALHDLIRRFRIVTPGGEIREVSLQSDPELFRAAQVSLGALGIITEFELALSAPLRLRRRVWVEPLAPLLERAEELASQHRNFEFYYLPGTDHAAVITHDAVDAETTGRPPSEDEDTLRDLRTLRDVAGWWPWLRRRLFGALVPTGQVEDGVAESWRMLSTARSTRFDEMEYHLPREAGLAGVQDTIAAIERRPEIWFPVEVRWTAGDDAWMSPFFGGPRVSIATHVPIDEPFDWFFSDIEPAHRDKGGRPHWGKLHSLKASDLARLYPHFEDFQRIRAQLDPAGRMLNPHLCELLGVEASRG